MFDEREAIRLEMQELKEQGRLDWDMYFELRRHKDKRYTELQDRLRTIDEREYARNAKSAPPESKRDTPMTRFADLTPAERTVDILRVKKEMENIEKKTEDVKPIVKLPVPSKKLKQSRTPFELVEKKVVEYLTWHEGEQQMKDIKSYVEKELNAKWENFSEVMQRIIDVTPRIKRGTSRPRGMYFMEKE